MELIINRPEQQHDSLRNYQLYVDGIKVSVLKPNSDTKINLPDEATFIQAKVDWCASPKFYVRDLKSNTLIVSNILSENPSAGIFAALHYITFGRKSYLTIENIHAD